MTHFSCDYIYYNLFGYDINKRLYNLFGYNITISEDLFQQKKLWNLKKDIIY